MSKLTRTDGSRRVLLRHDMSIGRSSQSDLRIDNPLVSSLHAQIRWTGAVWVVKDLGSTNGTQLDGVTLEAGVPTPVSVGAALDFGRSGDRWTLESGLAPSAFAVCGEQVVEAVADRVGLPSNDDPVLIIAPDAHGAWLAERVSTGEEWSVKDRQEIRLGVATWVLHLPGILQSTVGRGEDALSLPNLSLHFMARCGDEHVEIRARRWDREVELGAYTSYYLLLYLARARLEDAARGDVSSGEEGWRHQDEVLNDLRIDKLKLFTDTFRAKQYFAARGVLRTSSLIERRRDSGQIRLGVPQVTIDAG